MQYANDRKVFGGKPISSYQACSFRWPSRMPSCSARADEPEGGGAVRPEAALWHRANIAKLIGSQAASHAIERSMQTMGGMGYAREFHVERLWSDARLFKFAPVSEEMILNYIAIHDLGMPKSY